MCELQHSVGMAVAHLAASIETDGLHHKTISPALMFNGITKLQDFQSERILQQVRIAPHHVPMFRAESTQVLQLLQGTGIDPRQVRRSLRERIGDGGYQRAEEERISRAQVVRDAFDRACEIATEHDMPTVMVHHLLAALLEIPDTEILELLAEQDIDIEALREQAAALPMPEPEQASSTPLIDQLGTDLTEKARAGELSPVIGRKNEMLQIIKTLGRNKKNCPLLVGAAGVGKTAIVEGFAQRIAVQNIHREFHGKRIVQINASSLVSGTKYRGDFEERIEQIIAEVATAPDLILFIDEIHMLVGAGASGSGGMDAANILKPALAGGDIKLIGATTDSEYRQYIEKDSALARRFQVVRVGEPTKQETADMLSGVRQDLQESHQVTILNEAIIAAVELSVKYITDRFLPDKAYTLLDSACSEARFGSMLSYRPGEMDENQTINTVTEETVRKVIADQLDIPLDALEDEKERVARMDDALRQRIVGQDEAIDAVAQTVQRYYAGITQPNRPIGVFLFTGPTGVGKTELAKATAEFLFSDEKRMVRLNMGEYGEENSRNRLIGSPPGYVGYEEGGQLTNALHKSPYTVVLIDEVEKAHPNVLDVFLSVFDDGEITDAQGRTVNAKNAIFIMTSNLGYSNSDETPTKKDVKRAVHSHMRPEFINRIDSIVYFQPLQREHMEQLVRVQFARLDRQLDRHLIDIQVKEEAIQWLAERGYDPRMGARALNRLFNEKVTNEISRMLLTGEIRPGETAHIYLENDDIQIGKRTLPTRYNFE